MANYQTIMRLRPEVREFARNRRWVHRGDVIMYGANIRCDAFSTDGRGYRHSTFRGETLSVSECTKRERYGLVMGPSNVYGFGLAGNENTMPSLLAEHFGFPFGNIGLPEGNSRNLFSILASIIARSPRPPSVVLHISGGDFTNFCYTGLGDAVFGSPNLKQLKMVTEERTRPVNEERQMQALLAFSSLWTRLIVQLCRGANTPLVLAHDTTFFEKREPTDMDRQCGLGEAFNKTQGRQFDRHKKFVGLFSHRREALARQLDVPLAGPGPSNDIGFVDEFHCYREGTRDLCDDFAKGIESMLK